MMKKYICVLSFTILIQTNSLASGIGVKYSEAADYFEIMEQLSQWYSESDKAYYDNLKNVFLVSREDKHWFSWYAEFRSRTVIKATDENSKKDLFEAHTVFKKDVIADAFHRSDRPLQAFSRLQGKISKEDLQALGKFYEHFNSRIAALVRTSMIHQGRAKQLGEELKKYKVDEFVRKALQFYALMPVSKIADIQILFVWYPDKEKSSFAYGQNTLIVRMHPEYSGSEIDYRYLFMKLIDYIASMQSPEQKKIISSKFWAKCDPRGSFVSKDILQKPLSYIWGVMAPMEKIDKKSFQIYRQWSNNAWVNPYVKMLYPLVMDSDRNKWTITSDQFIGKAADLCLELFQIGKSLSPVGSD